MNVRYVPHDDLGVPPNLSRRYLVPIRVQSDCRDVVIVPKEETLIRLKTKQTQKQNETKRNETKRNETKHTHAWACAIFQVNVCGCVC